MAQTDEEGLIQGSPFEEEFLRRTLSDVCR